MEIKKLNEDLERRVVERTAQLNDTVKKLEAEILARKQAEAERQRYIHDLGERVKELRCLHNASLLLQNEDKTLPELLQEITNILPQAWQYPEITVARIKFKNSEFVTPDFSESPWK